MVIPGGGGGVVAPGVPGGGGGAVGDIFGLKGEGVLGIGLAAGCGEPGGGVGPDGGGGVPGRVLFGGGLPPNLGRGAEPPGFGAGGKPWLAGEA